MPPTLKELCKSSKLKPVNTRMQNPSANTSKIIYETTAMHPNELTKTVSEGLQKRIFKIITLSSINIKTSTKYSFWH